MPDVDRRTFLRLGTSGAMMVPLAGGSFLTPAWSGLFGAPLPKITFAQGPTAAAADGRRCETRPNQHAVILVDRRGERRIGRIGREAGAFNYPVGVAMMGDLAYVADCGNHRIQTLDRAGRCVGVIGESTLGYPGGIAATAAGEIVVADSRNARVISFTRDGQVTRALGLGVLSAPRGVAIDGDAVLVADPGARTVFEFDAGGRVRRTFGSDWVLPYDIATDGHHVFVIDASNASLAIFDRAGHTQETRLLQFAPSFLSMGGDGVLYIS